MHYCLPIGWFVTKVNRVSSVTSFQFSNIALYAPLELTVECMGGARGGLGRQLPLVLSPCLPAAPRKNFDGDKVPSGVNY